MNVRPTIIRRLLSVSAVAACVLAAPQAQAATGLLILEGSDAQTYHSLDPYSTNFLNGMATFSSNTALPIAIFGYNPVGTPTVGKVSLGGVLPDLATLLASYSGLYLDEGSSCCSEPSLTAAQQTTVVNFLAAGRSVAIEDYQGGAQFDSIIGITGAAAGTANAHVAGFGGGFSGIGSCFDGNIVAPGGGSFGLGAVGSGVPNINCFGHQDYQASFFDAYGLTTYIASNPTLPAFNVVISNGGGGLIEAVTTAAPEPASMALLGVALAGIGAVRRRKGA